jgi:hypothetical protein
LKKDRNGAKFLLLKPQNYIFGIKLVWADGGHTGKLVDWVKEHYRFVIKTVKRPDDQKGFQVLPPRWVIERAFSYRLSENEKFCGSLGQTIDLNRRKVHYFEDLNPSSNTVNRVKEPFSDGHWLER